MSILAGTSEVMSAAEVVVRELRPAPEPVDVFGKLGGRRHVLWLDSAMRAKGSRSAAARTEIVEAGGGGDIGALGRFSYLMADPVEVHLARGEEADVWERMGGLLQAYRVESLAELPPFQGGWAGLCGYDLGRQGEPVPRARHDEFGVPALALCCYDVVLAWDHAAGRAWLISQGAPEREPTARRRRAEQRAEEWLAWLDEGPRDLSPSPSEAVWPRLSLAELAETAAVPDQAGLYSNFTRAAYLETVARGVEYIRAGDVFQVNLAQRLLHAAEDDPRQLYLRLRERNPATFAGYFDLGEFQVLSASPERFVRVVAGQVETRPIKGTRRRSHWPEADLFAGDELLESAKDRAENVMIVDLLRNDLSRVCRPESVRVSELCRLESYAYVQHLVSVVRGELAEGRTACDLLRCAFPGGSVTGAPKVRARQIIAELEPHARGAYCGALGYFGFDGGCDWNLLIRTLTVGRGWCQFPVGGGIVAASDPRSEYEETWHKAEGMLRALRR